MTSENTELTREELLDLVEAQKAAIAELKATNAAEREKLFKSFLGVDDKDEEPATPEEEEVEADDWSEDIKNMEQRLINKFKGR